MNIIRGKAADLLRAATELNTLATLYVFARKMDQYPDGFGVQLEIPGLKLVLNSNTLRGVIADQLKDLGAKLDGYGVDLDEYVAELDALLATNQTGG